MKHDDLWSFALACYARPGVETACLELQSAGADVCLLLAGCWLESRGVAFDEARLAQLKSLSDNWRAEVVVPLRNLRQTWRQRAAEDSDLADLRAQVKSLELKAEHVQLQRLQSAAQEWPTGTGPADWLGQLCSGLGEATRSPQIALQSAAAQLAAGGGD